MWRTLPLSIPSPHVSSFRVGPLTIHFYALFILLGIAMAAWIASRRMQRRGGPAGFGLDVALWAVPFGIAGGRFYHVVTHPTDYFYPGADLWRIFFVWEGGLAIFGAIMFGALGAYIACHRAGIRFLSFADALAPGLLVAQAIGRIGNYFNQELYGAPTSLPWGLQIDPTMSPAFPSGLPPSTTFHPLFLYEMIWNLIGVGVILLVERSVALRWGKAIGLYFIWYGAGRVWLESLRLDPSEFLLWGVKINLLIAIGLALLGLGIILVQTHRHPVPETTPYRTRRPDPGQDPGGTADTTGEAQMESAFSSATEDGSPTDIAARSGNDEGDR